MLAVLAHERGVKQADLREEINYHWQIEKAAHFQSP